MTTSPRPPTTPRRPSGSLAGHSLRDYSFGEDVDLVVGLTAAALTGNEVFKASDKRDHHRGSHLLKAGLGAVVAAGAIGALRREHKDSKSREERHAERDEAKSRPHHEHRHHSDVVVHQSRRVEYARDDSVHRGERGVHHYAIEEDGRRHSHDEQARPVPQTRRISSTETAKHKPRDSHRQSSTHAESRSTDRRASLAATIHVDSRMIKNSNEQRGIIVVESKSRRHSSSHSTRPVVEQEISTPLARPSSYERHSPDWLVHRPGAMPLTTMSGAPVALPGVSVASPIGSHVHFGSDEELPHYHGTGHFKR